MKRLDFILANRGAGSRSQVRALIRRGHVCVDGVTVKDPSVQFEPDVSVTVDGKAVSPEMTVYCVMNKPGGYVCAADTEDSVLKLIPPELYRKDLFTVGRLDKDTTGLLIITNDGDFSHCVTSPKKKTEKTYRATLTRRVTQQDVDRFAEGIPPFAPAKLIPGEGLTAAVTVTEGQFHEVKRLFAATGNEVTALHRLSIGEFQLPEDLAPGQVRALTEEEKTSILK